MLKDQAVKELAPHGVLRAAINMGNALLVTGRAPNGDPTGVSPSMAAAIAERLGVPVQFVPYPRPNQVTDDAGRDKWDIANVGAEPQRADKTAFTAAYCEIEATYLVPPGSPIRSIGDVDRPGARIALKSGSAFDLWLQRNLKHARLIYNTPEVSEWQLFTRDKLEAFAGLRPALLDQVGKLPGARMLEGNFTTVQQAVGCDKRCAAGAQFLAEFVEEAKQSGLVERLIAQHQVRGLSVAPPA